MALKTSKQTWQQLKSNSNDEQQLMDLQAAMNMNMNITKLPPIAQQIK